MAARWAKTAGSLMLFLAMNCQASRDDQNGSADAAKDKPWFMRDLDIGGTVLPVSPVTLVVGLVALVNVLHFLTSSSGPWAEVSHILVKDSSNKTKEMLTGMKKDIGRDLRKFGDYAKKYSQCPSKANQGDLGRFAPGAMVPPFDKVCFDPKSSTGMALGPVQTQFGYHLIYIRERST